MSLYLGWQCLQCMCMYRLCNLLTEFLSAHSSLDMLEPGRNQLDMWVSFLFRLDLLMYIQIHKQWVVGRISSAFFVAICFLFFEFLLLYRGTFRYYLLMNDTYLSLSLSLLGYGWKIRGTASLYAASFQCKMQCRQYDRTAWFKFSDVWEFQLYSLILDALSLKVPIILLCLLLCFL